MTGANEFSVVWRASSYSSTNGGACVEVGEGVAGVVPVRDSKVPDGSVLVFAPRQWARFVGFATGRVG
ncbi:DUF397 domain-containing protein [Streptomyces sp. JNUCC 64]